MALHSGLHNVNGIIPPVKQHPIYNIINITNSIQPASGKYFVVIDLANMFSVYFNSPSDAVCLQLLRTQGYMLSQLPTGYLSILRIIQNLCMYNPKRHLTSPRVQVCHDTDDILLQGDSFLTLSQDV